MADDENGELSKIYYEPSNEAGYAGARRISHKTRNKVDKNKIYKWLRAQDAYTLHKPVHRKFQRLHYRANEIDSVWEGDLIELCSLKSYNDEFSYIVVVIDVLSKYVWVEPLKDKSCTQVTKAFKNILSRSSGRVPRLFQTDKGKEFIGTVMQQFLKSKNILHRVTRNPDVKAAIVERFNRTLKEKMWRYFTYKNSRRYIDVLQDLVTGYNNGYHSTIKMAPSCVTVFNASTAKKNMDSRYKTVERKAKYAVGNLVRISRTKGTFEKGYMANWSEEIFKIIRVLKHRKPPVYEIEDLNGETVDGIFYEEELSVIDKNISEASYKIDKILKTSGSGSRKKYFVSWVGYPSTFNSWVPASDVQNI